MQNIRIELPKGVEDGKTSLSPSNPPRSNSGSPVVSNRGKIIAGVGLLAANQFASGIINDIAEGGNQELAKNLQNIMVGARVLIGAAATGGVSLIYEGVNVGTKALFTNKSVARKNASISFENEMRGERINWSKGGGW